MLKLVKYIEKMSVKKIFNSRMLAMALIMLMLSWEYDQPFLEFVKQKEYPITWCIFPFFLSNHQFLAIFFSCIIYINSDVPFMQHENMYQVIRTGRRQWAVGQIGGICARSFFAAVMAAVIAALPFLGRLEWTNEWGKVVYTIATKDVSEAFLSENYLQFMFYYEILGEFTPLQLMGLTISLCVLIGILIGFLMFLISLFAERVFAVSGAFVFVILLYFVQNASPRFKQQVAYFVPTYWAAVSLIATPSSGYYRLPPVSYMFTFLFAATAIVLTLILRRVGHIEFNWEHEDT